MEGAGPITIAILIVMWQEFIERQQHKIVEMWSWIRSQKSNLACYNV